MAALQLTRDFPVSPDRLFAALTQQADLLQWWGPEGMHCPEHALDLSKLGPWHSVMVNAEGERYKVSGQVTSYDPPRSVGFTWAWHDPEDNRGAESHVTFTISGTESGSRLVLDHRELGDDEIAANHDKGWSSSLRKLDALLG
jgi:uncharacterized protein YndB with AHSA1/START domain